MATYRINGIKYNPANWAGLEKAERAGVAKFAAQREKELNTITTTEHICHGGPFDGSKIELHGADSAQLCVGAWVGRYTTSTHPVSGSHAQWVGNDGGKAIATHAKASSATAPEVTQKGFDQLRDLLADLAEDVSEKEKIVTMHGRKITWAVGAVDDFGNAIAGDVPTHCNQVMEPVPAVGGYKKRRYLLTVKPGHGTMFMDGWGNLQKAPQPRNNSAAYSVPCERVQYRIGATTYTVKAAAESVASLRAKIIKSKRWFSDAMLPTNRMKAAQAAAAQAIDNAQASACAAGVAEVATLAGEPELIAASACHVSATAQKSQETEPEAMAEELATACAAEATACTQAGDTTTPRHATPATTTTRMDGAPGAGQPASTTRTAGHSTGHSSHTGHAGHHHAQALARADGQRISGKSGKWQAVFYTAPGGALAMTYTGTDGQPQAMEYITGSERMRALQAMAREADAPAKQQRRQYEGVFVRVSKKQAEALWDAGEPVAMLSHRRESFATSTKNAESQEFATFQEKTSAGESCLRYGEKLYFYAPQATAAPTAPATPASTTPAPRASQPAEPEAMAATHTPTPQASQGGQVGGVPAASAPHYTGSLKTMGADYSDPLKTSGTDYTPPPKTSGGALSITITRAEGPSAECGIPHTVGSFAEADALLAQWAGSVPAGGGYDKCRFCITWPNGDTYEGRYDLMHPSRERPSLADHMANQVDFYTGKGCPVHMSAARYADFMASVEPERRASYEAVERMLNAAGVHTGRARPMAADLRALVAAGLPVAGLVGLEVYHVGRHGDTAKGAIVAADESGYYGLEVGVITEDGTTHHGVSAKAFSDRDGVQWKVSTTRHGAPYLAQLAAAVATRKAQATAAKELEAKARADDLARLAVEFAHLERGHGCVVAARNMRALLKAAFPTVKFSVRTRQYSGGNSVYVSWTDGPTSEAVNAIVGKFTHGSFNGMDDSYEFNRGAFTDLFGGCYYLTAERTESPELIARALAEVYTDPATRPSVEDWQKQRGPFDFGDCNHWNRVNFRQHLGSIDATPPAKTTRKAKA